MAPIGTKHLEQGKGNRNGNSTVPQKARTTMEKMIRSQSGIFQPNISFLP